MKAARLSLPPLVLLLAALGACVPASAPPAASRQPSEPPVREGSPPPPGERRIDPRTIGQALPSFGWIDAPLTQGSWRYVDYGPGRGKRALYFPGEDEAFDLTCVFEPSGPQILLIRSGRPPADAVQMTIRTETEQRTLIARVASANYAIAALPVSDPLLDAMALSKGRFAVEVDGYATLILPSHAEVSRVIEDCR